MRQDRLLILQHYAGLGWIGTGRCICNRARIAISNANRAPPTESIREHNALPIGQINHAEIDTGLGPVLGRFGLALRMLRLDAVEGFTNIFGNVRASGPVVPLKVANALIHVLDLLYYMSYRAGQGRRARRRKSGRTNERKG